jgi:hypothetical protein
LSFLKFFSFIKICLLADKQERQEMFKNNFAVSLKVDEKFLRENKDEVNIGFGEEYSIYIKNLDSKRALV